MKDNLEKSLKRYLKRKVKVTLGLVVAFMITGSVGYADDWGKISVGKDKIEDISLTTDSTATGIEVRNNGTLNITGNHDLVFENVTTSRFDSVIKTVEGNLDIEGKVVGKNIKGQHFVSLFNAPNKLNFAGGIEVDTMESTHDSGAVIRTQEAEFKTAFLDIDNITMKESFDYESGVFSIAYNTKAIIGTEDKLGDLTINTVTFKTPKDGGWYANGFSVTCSEIEANTISIDTMTSEGKESYLYGIYTNVGRADDAAQPIIKANNIIVKNLTGNGKETTGIRLSGANLGGTKEGVANNLTIENITSTSKNGIVYGICANKTYKDEKYGIPELFSSMSIGGDLNIKNINAENSTAYGMYFTGKSTGTIGGDSLVTVNGGGVGTTLNLTDSQKEILVKGNNTISKVLEGKVTQGVRVAKGSTLTFGGKLDISSSDIAMTAIGKESNITVNGDSSFKGNSYLIDGATGEENSHLIVRPVVQALEGGKITLGNTEIKSLKSENETTGRITNVGIYAQQHVDLGNIGNTPTEERTEINISGNATVDSDIAIMATAGGHVHINKGHNHDGNEIINNGDVLIKGDIVAGKHGSTVDIAGKNVNVLGELIAANGGRATLDLNSENSVFTGRADNYFDLVGKEGDLGGEMFRNEKYSMDITKAGKVNINMDNGAKWVVTGQSFVTNLNFGANGGIVDLTNVEEIVNDKKSSLSIDTIGGNGTFNMVLDSADKSQGNMLYISRVAEGTKDMLHTVNISGRNLLDLEIDEKLRFATLGEEAKGKMTFVVNDTKEEGVRNVEYDVNHENYMLDDKENTTYNGNETSEAKLGNTVANNTYHDGENWYLTRTADGEINDGGKTIIEMSKANYASAVYLDNLNKRLGDMSFVEGNEGLWVRLRNDRVGEDHEYRLHNNMYQIGYDKPYPMDEGKGTEYRGIAFEYSEGEVDFKNINGDANVDRYALWLYDTNVYNDGKYSDYVFRVGRMSNDFEIYGRETGNKVEGDYDNLFLGLSAEYGYRKDLDEDKKSYFEPQVQLQYTYIDDTDYTTNQNSKVDLDSIHSLIGRAGFRLGHDFYDDNGNKTTTVYAKADINHEFLGDQEVTAKDKTGSIREKYENDETWYDIGLGAEREITPDFNVYMDVEKQFGTSRDNNSWQFNLGFRYRFGEKVEQTVPKLTPVTMRTISLDADSYFDFDKSELKPEGKKSVANVAKVINDEKLKGSILLEGHTDSKGSEAYNQKLSERRVEAVKEELKKNITSEDIHYETKGYGETRPIADNSTAVGRAKNRRVDIKYETQVAE